MGVSCWVVVGGVVVGFLLVVFVVDGGNCCDGGVDVVIDPWVVIPC